MLIIFGLPLRHYVALYLWVDTNIVGSERKVPIKVPIKVVGSER